MRPILCSNLDRWRLSRPYRNLDPGVDPVGGADVRGRAVPASRCAGRFVIRSRCTARPSAPGTPGSSLPGRDDNGNQPRPLLKKWPVWGIRSYDHDRERSRLVPAAISCFIILWYRCPFVWRRFHYESRMMVTSLSTVRVADKEGCARCLRTRWSSAALRILACRASCLFRRGRDGLRGGRTDPVAIIRMYHRLSEGCDYTLHFGLCADSPSTGAVKLVVAIGPPLAEKIGTNRPAKHPIRET